jgi:hypothetical protein
MRPSRDRGRCGPSPHTEAEVQWRQTLRAADFWPWPTFWPAVLIRVSSSNYKPLLLGPQGLNRGGPVLEMDLTQPFASTNSALSSESALSQTSRSEILEWKSDNRSHDPNEAAKFCVPDNSASR